MSKNTVNILVLGQTGVGKSSLINYIFGDRRQESGTGKPQTVRGFHNNPGNINGIPVNIIDSWGLENGKDKEWAKDLDDLLEKHQIHQPVNEWIHTAIYCINAAGHRIQDYDIDIIKRFIKEKYKVVIVLTSASKINEEAFQDMKSVISQSLGEGIKIVAVNSVAEKLMGGLEISAFGKEELIFEITSEYIEMLKKRLPERIMYVLREKIKEYDNDLRKKNFYDAEKKAEEITANFHKVIQQTVASEVKLAVKTLVDIQNVFSPGSKYSAYTMQDIISFLRDTPIWETIKDFWTRLLKTRNDVASEAIEILEKNLKTQEKRIVLSIHQALDEYSKRISNQYEVSPL